MVASVTPIDQHEQRSPWHIGPLTLVPPAPYAESALALQRSGLGGPLPLPSLQKFPPPTGWSGAGALYPSGADVAAWTEDTPAANVGLRLADGVKGIDVDAYGDKEGASTLAAAEATLGALPPTFMSTSRHDGVSGIRLFRAPADTVLVSTLGAAGYGPHVEMVQPTHRYVVAPPSIHPEGREYRWVGPDGVDLLPGEVPSVDDLPELPPAWVAGLAVDAERADVGREVLAPLDTWPAAAATDPYVVQVCAGIATDIPRGDWHAWTFSTACRLAAAARLGLITRADLSASHRVVVARLRTARSSRSSGEEPEREAARCWRDAVERTARMTVEQARISLGIREAPAPTTATATAEDAPAADQLDEVVAGFWRARPCLAHIHQFAHARMVSPWALLGVVMARAVAAAPPTLVLPATVGGYGSLNLFVALVGESGGGKGAAEAAARDAVVLATEVESASVGSGEGIGHLYAHREKGGVVRDRTSVLFTVPEVDTLTALGSRQGATLLPQLRSAWSGEALGFAYADPTKRLPIEGHTYRMAVVLGVQPGRAAGLLEDSDGGTPQRFVWLPVTDPTIPAEPVAEPEPLSVALPRMLPSSRYVMRVCDTAVQRIRAARLARARGEGDPLDGHALFCRLKVAAALALLEEREIVTDEDWRLADVVMRVSHLTRAGVAAHLRSQSERANVARGKAEGARAAVAAEAVADHTAQRVGRVLVRHLRNHGEQSRNDLRKRLPGRDRPHYDEALARLESAGLVSVTETEHGERLALAEVDP
ncbi:bifunctional DNA primase/polymerase [Quadrisphaera sp. INWT6]|uniref:bifunctional DNA primase/polymerase n=1 Tax=Quadrisphaera sp. INWT6 TaxID=2596917 RepID=UPI0018923634|nr:bifunctional DNA primase/polymerase [Quadrisphaera sp. INWT6]MBF5081384.1 bifunctional DNA primase/polymerase [Quadrisphaera sp. INWT6]